MFLLRRNLPLAWAGWYDDFARPPENPLKPPWKHLGGGESYINDQEELVITEQIVNSDGRGPSYTWMPFTPNWGFETEIWYPVGGADNQHFFVAFTDSWTNVGATFQNVIAVVFRHNLFPTPEGIWYAELETMFSNMLASKQWDSPVPSFNGQYLRLRVWVENDEYIRIWVNDTYVGSSMISPAFKLGPGRRCMRFMNRSYCNVWVRWVNHYDRPPTVPPKSAWSSLFYDDFARPDGAVGNGWTQYGTQAGIVSGRYAFTGTDTRSVGLLRNVGNLGGRCRIEATVRNPNNTADSSLILCANAAGNQGLVANIYQGHVYLGRLTSSLDGTPSFYDFQDIGLTVADGDKLAFSVFDNMSWLEVNGVPRLYAGNVHDVVPSTNAYAGLRVRRDGSTNSNSFDDVRIYSGVGL